MAKVKKNIVFLQCTICNSRNYSIYKGKNVQDKIERKKYCSKCRKHTSHTEAKIK